MIASEHQNVPVATLHEQDGNGPVTLLRDYDTLLIDRWRLSLEESRKLRDHITGSLLDMALAREEMAEEARDLAGPVDGEGSDVD